MSVYRTNRICFILIILIGNFMMLGKTAKAGEWEAMPSLSLRETYDDHTLGTNQRSGDLVSELSAGISIALREPKEKTTFQYQISLARYTRFHDRSTSPDHRLFLTRRTEWTTRLETALNNALNLTSDPTRFNAKRDSASPGEILFPRTDTLRNRFDYTLAYKTAPEASLELAFFRSDSRYGDPTLFDSAVNGVSLARRERWTSRSAGSFSYTFSRNSLEQGKSGDIHLAQAGYEHSLSRTVSAALKGGSSYSTQDRRFLWVYDAGLTKTFNRGGVFVSAQRDVQAAEGIFESNVVSTAYSLRGAWSFTEVLQGSILETYRQSRSIGGVGERASASTTSASLDYRINAHWTGSVGYQHLRQRTEPATIGNFHSNQISIALTWAGPPWRP